ncbi:hypothetical protein PLICRDRAFT_161638 [Plicaturopsis crispa FD-325 SS-3]|nr:hypothetical protein PLICRDRAFT_161638 [Plicaturopsis crispa FD-325 SS-3]
MDELSLRNRQNRAAKDKILHDPEKLKAVENNINVTGDQITELAEEVANLIGSTRSREDEYARMKQENEEMRQRHAELEKALQEFQEAHEKQRAEMNTISAALAAHLARPPSPPTSPISPEYILQAIEQPLTDSVHAHVQPLIDNLREQIGELLKARNAETYATLWNKLTMTLRVMETLSARVEKEQGALAPSNSNATR